LCNQKEFFFLKILDFLTFGGIVHVFWLHLILMYLN